jgi:hypothetical protein
LGGGMVLARDLHKRIQDIQIQIGASTRVAHLEKEISTLTDAVNLLVSKLEKPIPEDTSNPYEDENGKTKKIDRKAIPEDNDEKWKEYLDDNDELDADKILADEEMKMKMKMKRKMKRKKKRKKKRRGRRKRKKKRIMNGLKKSLP